MAPSFLLLPDGSSRIALTLSRQVAVELRPRGRRLVFWLKTAQVGIHNNTNPLVTLHFPTPLAVARLVRQENGVELRLDLREEVTPRYVTRTGPADTMILEVTLPRPSKTYDSPPKRPDPSN